MKLETLHIIKVEPEIKQALGVACETNFCRESDYRKVALVEKLKKDGFLK